MTALMPLNAAALAGGAFAGRTVQLADVSNGSSQTTARARSTGQAPPPPFDGLMAAARPPAHSGVSSSRPASPPDKTPPTVSLTADTLRTASLKRSKSNRLSPAFAEHDRTSAPPAAQRIRSLPVKRSQARPAKASPGTDGQVVVSALDRLIPPAALATATQPTATTKGIAQNAGPSSGAVATTLASGQPVIGAPRLQTLAVADVNDADGVTPEDDATGRPPVADTSSSLPDVRVASAGAVAAAASTTLRLAAAAAAPAEPAGAAFATDPKQLLHDADFRANIQSPTLGIASFQSAAAVNVALAPLASALKPTAEAIDPRLPPPVLEAASKRSSRPDGPPVMPASKEHSPVRVESAPLVPALAAPRTSFAAFTPAASDQTSRPPLPGTRATLEPAADNGAPGFRIDSQSLGPVSAALTQPSAASERLHVHFTVDRAATAALIASGSDRLEQTLSATGMRLGSLAVAIGPHVALGQPASAQAQSQPQPQSPWSSPESPQGSASRSDAREPRREQPDPSSHRPRPARSLAAAALTRDRFA